MNNRIIHIILPILASLWLVAAAIISLWQQIPTGTIEVEGMITGIFDFLQQNNLPAVIINITVVIAIAWLLTHLNNLFSLTREQTYLPALFFIMTELLCPTLIIQFTTANIATLLVCIVFFILYSCYQQGSVPSQAFLIALLLSVISIFHARILFFIPLFIIGFYQMRAQSLRSFLGGIIGLITLYWILWGMGWIEWQQIDFDSLKIEWQWLTPRLEHIGVLAVILLGLFTGTCNLLNAYTEKIQTRAYNGFVNLLSVYTALILCIDHTHYMMYLPLLNAAVSLQASYYFTTRHNKANTILFYSLLLIFIAWQIWILHLI